MKITITFEIPDKNWKAGIKYWKLARISMTWKKWIRNTITQNFTTAQKIKIRIEK